MRQSRYRKATQKTKSSRSMSENKNSNSPVKSIDEIQRSSLDTTQDAGFLSSLLSFITNIFT
jgi:hypothetical protein